FLIL
ncbi:hypothetical protein VTH06DRAFT_4388, partial [Thermothelomyces fergusii]